MAIPAIDPALFQPSYRKTIRSMINPADKSTVISIYPKEINEEKPTITPGKFHIPAASIKNPQVLVVGSSSWWLDREETQPLLEIPVHSLQVARSIVDDYCNGLLACNMDTAMPGLMYVPGMVTLEQIKTNKATLQDNDEDGSKFRMLYNKMVTRQRNWFDALVKIADSLWTRSGGNPITISDDMKLAARELGLDNKEWLVDSAIVSEMIRCINCGSMRNPTYPTCPTCRLVVDKELAKKLGL